MGIWMFLHPLLHCIQTNYTQTSPLCLARDIREIADSVKSDGLTGAQLSGIVNARRRIEFKHRPLVYSSRNVGRWPFTGSGKTPGYKDAVSS